ncbi:hypothetical protein GWI33_022121 [Rhynchophorus ferrugineus]|uniref:Uncharacterized protein n=1 Tax=Rhynchophorus ferrugineus TaxID=354439 RepID=A0A834MLG4_RHYFE|nr:hypothetical protein GWI33_022121 [Rhynchophorus ferrugineus]
MKLNYIIFCLNQHGNAGTLGTGCLDSFAGDLFTVTQIKSNGREDAMDFFTANNKWMRLETDVIAESGRAPGPEQITGSNPARDRKDTIWSGNCSPITKETASAIV